MVKIGFEKRDLVWIGLIVVLIGIGFVYAYGGSEPSVVGHSASELEEEDPTVIVSVKDGVSWDEVSDKPAGFADDSDDGGMARNNCYWTGVGTHGSVVCPVGYYLAGVCFTNSGVGCNPSVGGASTQSEWQSAGGGYCCKAT
jgi:hypothetical protein